MRRRKLTPAERQKQIEPIRAAVFGTPTRRANQAEISRETGISPKTISGWKKTPTAMPAVGLAKMIQAQELPDEEVLRIMRMMGDV
jgi:hypothetical protein